ncbi:MAG: mercury resistance protein [Candidatus Tectomicrobia bacterium]|nr:mercury resistance protein [Candidatus Tectomicrobia bacterium]
MKKGGMERPLVRKVLLGAAFLLCPCHLPIYLALLGGTAAGALLAENPWTAAAAMTAAFIGALVPGLRWSKRKMSVKILGGGNPK